MNAVDDGNHPRSIKLAAASRAIDLHPSVKKKRHLFLLALGELDSNIPSCPQVSPRLEPAVADTGQVSPSASRRDARFLQRCPHSLRVARLGYSQQKEW